MLPDEMEAEKNRKIIVAQAEEIEILKRNVRDLQEQLTAAYIKIKDNSIETHTNFESGECRECHEEKCVETFVGDPDSMELEGKVEENEKDSFKVQRRSIRTKTRLKKGHIISRKDLVILRPRSDKGLSPSLLDRIIGKKLSSDVEIGDEIIWKKIES